MSESMTVEQAMAQAADAKRWVENGLYADNKLAIASVVLADGLNAQMANSRFHEANHCAAEKEIEALQARVAELEAEKWNAQIAEAALLSVEKERDTLETDCDHANSQRAAAEQERDELRRRFNSLMSTMIRISKSSRDEGGCYYTNRGNIRLACDAVKANQIEGGA